MSFENTQEQVQQNLPSFNGNNPTALNNVNAEKIRESVLAVLTEMENQLTTIYGGVGPDGNTLKKLFDLINIVINKSLQAVFDADPDADPTINTDSLPFAVVVNENTKLKLDNFTELWGESNLNLKSINGNVTLQAGPPSISLNKALNLVTIDNDQVSLILSNDGVKITSQKMTDLESIVTKVVMDGYTHAAGVFLMKRGGTAGGDIDPGAGNYDGNTGTATSLTQMVFSKTTQDGYATSTFLSGIVGGDLMYVGSPDIVRGGKYRVTSVVDNGDHYTVGLVNLDWAGSTGLTTNMCFRFAKKGGAEALASEDIAYEADTVKAALDGLIADVVTLEEVIDTGSSTAASTSLAPVTGLLATDLQAAIEEIMSKIENGQTTVYSSYMTFTEFEDGYQPTDYPIDSQGGIYSSTDTGAKVFGGLLICEAPIPASGKYDVSGRSEWLKSTDSIDLETDTSVFRGYRQIKQRRTTTTRLKVRFPKLWPLSWGRIIIFQRLFQRVMTDFWLAPVRTVDLITDLQTDNGDGTFTVLIDPRTEPDAPKDKHYIVYKVGTDPYLYWYFDEMDGEIWKQAPELNYPPYLGVEIAGEWLGLHYQGGNDLNNADGLSNQQHYIKGLCKMEENVWYTLEIVECYDPVPGRDGYLRIKVNDQVVYHYTGPLGSPGPYCAYSKGGVYRNSLESIEYCDFVRKEASLSALRAELEYIYQFEGKVDDPTAIENSRQMAWCVGGSWYVSYPNFDIPLDQDHWISWKGKIYNNNTYLYKGDGNALHDFLMRLWSGKIEIYYMDGDENNCIKVIFNTPGDVVLDNGIPDQTPDSLVLMNDVSEGSAGISLHLNGIALTTESVEVIGTGFAFGDNGGWDNFDHVFDRWPDGYHGHVMVGTGLLTQANIDEIVAHDEYGHDTDDYDFSPATIQSKAINDGDTAKGTLPVPVTGGPRYQSHLQQWNSIYREDILPKMDEIRYYGAAQMPYGGADSAYVNGGMLQTSIYLKDGEPVHAYLFLHGAGEYGTSGSDADLDKLKTRGPLYGGQWNDYTIKGSKVVLFGIQFKSGSYGENSNEVDEVAAALDWLSSTYNCIGGKAHILPLSQGGTPIKNLIKRGEQDKFRNGYFISSYLDTANYTGGPNTGNPIDLSGKIIKAVHGLDDAVFPFDEYWDTNLPASNAGEINANSQGNPISAYAIAGYGHEAYVWQKPFAEERMNELFGWLAHENENAPELPDQVAITAFENQSAVLSTDEETEIKSFVNGLVADNVYDGIRDLAITAGFDDPNAGNVGIKGVKNVTKVGSATYTKAGGIEIYNYASGILFDITPAVDMLGDNWELMIRFGSFPSPLNSQRIAGCDDGTVQVDMSLNIDTTKVFWNYRGASSSWTGDLPGTGKTVVFRCEPSGADLIYKMIIDNVQVGSVTKTPTVGLPNAQFAIGCKWSINQYSLAMVGAHIEAVGFLDPGTYHAAFEGRLDTVIANLKAL